MTSRLKMSLIAIAVLLIPRQLAPSPMMIFAVRIELALDVAVQSLMTPIRANIVGPPSVATRIRASMAACHSAAS
jgi:hypothetical protein